MHRFWDEYLDPHGPEVVYLVCEKKEEEGHNWDHKEKGLRALQHFQEAPLSLDPSSSSLTSGRIVGSLEAQSRQE